MFSPDDTIVAIATPPGRGGIGVVRISGPEASGMAVRLLERKRPLQARRATLARIPGVDAVIATLFPAPHSYTGQDVVEVSAHGSPLILRRIVEALIRAGARLAEPGEFTLRAFLNGRLDLAQAEAVADLVDAVTPLQARTAFDQLEGTLTRRITEIDARLFDLIARLEASLDFPDEGFHFIEPPQITAALRRIVQELEELLGDARTGRTIREGAHVVVTGRPNVGKSSLFNKLAGHDRAIVTAVPGTTRDLVTETVDLMGVPVTLVDTAGVRETVDLVEREGVNRAREAAGVASLLVVVLDQSEPLRDDDSTVLAVTSHRERLIVRNKIDLPAAWPEEAIDQPTLGVAAATGAGVTALRAAIARRLTHRDDLRDPPAISNIRHIGLLEDAGAHLRRALHALGGEAAPPEEFLLTDLQAARGAFDEIVGRRTTDDLLQHIFARFCIGK